MSRSNEVEIPEASQAILAANSLGILTTIRHKDGRISSNPVGYVWDGGRSGRLRCSLLAKWLGECELP